MFTILKRFVTFTILKVRYLHDAWDLALVGRREEGHTHRDIVVEEAGSFLIVNHVPPHLVITLD